MSEKFKTFWDKVRSETVPSLSTSQKYIIQKRHEEALQKPIRERKEYEKFSYLIGKKFNAYLGNLIGYKDSLTKEEWRETPNNDIGLVVGIKITVDCKHIISWDRNYGCPPNSKYTRVTLFIEYNGSMYEYDSHFASSVADRFIDNNGDIINNTTYDLKVRNFKYFYPTEDQF